MTNQYRVYNYKSPILAGLMSFIIPGLGQFYNDERGKAILIVTAFFMSLFIAITGWNPLMSFRLFHNYHFSEVFTMGVGFRSFSDPNLVNLYRLLFFMVVAPIIYIFQLFDAIFSAQRINRHITVEAQGAGIAFAPSGSGAAPASFAFSQDALQPPPRSEANPTMNASGSGGEPSSPPPTGSSTPDPAHFNGSRNRIAWGVVLAIIGFAFLLSDLFHDFNPFDLWPLIPLAFGLKLLWDYSKNKETGQLIAGAILTVVGLVFMAEMWSPIRPFDVLSDMIETAIDRWYLALLFIGLFLIVQELVRRNNNRTQ